MWSVRDIDQEIVKSRMSAILPRYIGPGTSRSFALVAEATDNHRNGVERWYRGEALPSLDNFLKLIAFLGPAFANEWLGAIGMGGAHAVDDPESNDMKINSSIAGVVAKFGKALEDGRVDHRERQELQQEVKRILPSLEGFVGDEK